jgi:hypothetical protein
MFAKRHGREPPEANRIPATKEFAAAIYQTDIATIGKGKNATARSAAYAFLVLLNILFYFIINHKILKK